MFIFSFTALCFVAFVLYEQFIKKDPLDTIAPDDNPVLDYYSDEDEREYDPEWDDLTDEQKTEKLDKQLDEYYKPDGKKAMLAWAYIFGYNKGKATKQD